MKTVTSPNITMTYYNPTVVDPAGEEAGEIAQRVADTAKGCGYPDCHREVCGCAVHETAIKTKNGYKEGAHFLPVCVKHANFEFEKKLSTGGWEW